MLLTIIIKSVFYPLNHASARSMAKMKVIAPKLKALQEQYANDKQQLQIKMMEMYKQEKINPLGGCLPILVQIPVFIALYWVLLSAVELRHAPWIGWIQDLSAPDPYFVLPVVYAITAYLQVKLSPTPISDPVQAKVMQIMPIAFSVMFVFFPSGLVLYWLINNSLQIFQQWHMNRVLEKEAAARRRQAPLAGAREACGAADCRPGFPRRRGMTATATRAAAGHDRRDRHAAGPRRRRRRPRVRAEGAGASSPASSAGARPAGRNARSVPRRRRRSARPGPRAATSRRPRSYTGEDVLELHGHGGPAVLRLLLARCLELGARLARPGEFTQRAFLNGKLDLAQAESVADLIDAATATAARAAARSLSGAFSREIRALAEALVELRMFTEATLDFPDEDLDFLRAADARGRLGGDPGAGGAASSRARRRARSCARA